MDLLKMRNIVLTITVAMGVTVVASALIAIWTTDGEFQERLLWTAGLFLVLTLGGAIWSGWLTERLNVRGRR